MNPNQPTIKYTEDGTKLKQCTKCLEWKDFHKDFLWRNSTHKKKQCKCRTCANRYREELRKRDVIGYKNWAREKKLKSKFGITLDSYNDISKLQNNCCYICGGINNNKNLAVDHNHETGQIRKLLCSQCNTALGHVKEDYTTIIKLVWYLYIHNNNIEMTFNEFIKQDILSTIVKNISTE